MPDLTDDEVRALFSDFEREISTWPRAQAAIALDVLDAVISGEEHEVEALHGREPRLESLTLEQMQTIERVVRKIMGDWTH
jgi:hypothetical protein